MIYPAWLTTEAREGQRDGRHGAAVIRITQSKRSVRGKVAGEPLHQVRDHTVDAHHGRVHFTARTAHVPRTRGTTVGR